MSKNYFIKTNRTFTFLRKYAWIVTLLVALGGFFWEPKLGLIVMLIMVGLMTTAFFTGRYWCGNICPHGSLFDVLILPLSINLKIPKFLKSKAMMIGFFAFFMYNFSSKILRVISTWGATGFWDRLGRVFSGTYLMVLVAGGVLGLLVNSRTWCQFCPMGSIQKLSYAAGKGLGVAKKTDLKVQIHDTSMCHLCGKCSRVCPFQLTPYLEFSKNGSFDNPNCIRCSTCVENCPAGILRLSTDAKACDLREDMSLEGYQNRQEILATITKVTTISKDTREYTFRFDSPNTLDYKAGQFILLKIQDSPKAYRAYSISSYNEDSKSLKVIIRKVDKGFGTGVIFDSFVEGKEVTLEGPMGNELVLDRSADKVMFIGNGIGITPFIALSKDALINLPNLKSAKLLYGARYESEFLYEEYFRDLAKENETFEYLPIASRPKAEDAKKGYVTDLLKEIDVTGYKVYMCGSKNMICDCYDILINKGLKASDIHYESEEKIKGLPDHHIAHKSA